MNKDKKLVFGILALLVGIVAVSISYAAFTQNLNINGVANVQATNWSVHFVNLSNGVRTKTAQEQTTPTIKNNSTSIGDYAVNFYTPGDSIAYTFDVVNSGDYDAKISVFTKGTPQCNGTDPTSNTNVCANLEYTLKYTATGKTVALNDTLGKGQTKRMTLKLTYKSNMAASQLPSAEVTVSNLGITMQYSQDSLAGGNKPIYLYAANSSYSIGDTLTVNNTNVFDNYSDAVAAFGFNFFIEHVVNENNIITESYAGFVKNGTAYYLKAGDGGASYNTNKDILYSVFGSLCDTYRVGTQDEIYACGSGDNGNYMQGYYTAVSGGAGYNDDGLACWVGNSGNSFCHSLMF